MPQESNGNYSTNTGNGFFGAYQFLLSTWDKIAKLAGRINLIGVNPAYASPADQDDQAWSNFLISGIGQWPRRGACAYA